MEATVSNTLMLSVIIFYPTDTIAEIFIVALFALVVTVWLSTTDYCSKFLNQTLDEFFGNE